MIDVKEKTAIRKNLAAIKQELPERVTLVAVTKYHNLEETKAVIDCGIENLGENKVQDLVKKMDSIDAPVHWHFIGHLQQNKVKYLIGRVFLIESVDSVRLLEKIDAESRKAGVITDVLIQYNLTGEPSKSGFLEEETQSWLDSFEKTSNIRIRGLMGMGPNTKDHEAVHKVFSRIAAIYGRMKQNEPRDRFAMELLSMGMSGDYPIAVQAGANIVRIGSKIFNQETQDV